MEIMEEKILEIIKSHTGFPAWQANSAKEITAHVMEFAEWLIFQTRYKYNSKTKFWTTNTVANFTWENIYQHWWDKVKNK